MTGEKAVASPLKRPARRMLQRADAAVSPLASDASVCWFVQRQPTSAECVTLTPDERLLAVGRTDGQVDVYDPIEEILLFSLPGGEGRSVQDLMWIRRKERVADVVSDLDKWRLITVGLQGDLTEWDLRSMLPIREIQSFGGAVFCASVSPHNENLCAVGCDDGGVRIFALNNSALQGKPATADDSSGSDVEHEECLSLVKTLTRHQSRVSNNQMILSLAWMDENTLYGGTGDAAICQWNVTSGAMTESWRVGGNAPERGTTEQPLAWSLAAVPEYNLLVSSDSKGRVALWDTATGTTVNAVTAHEGPALGVSLGAAGAVYTAGSDGRLSVWAAAGGNQLQLIRRIQVLPSDATCLAASKLHPGRCYVAGLGGEAKFVTKCLHVQPEHFPLPSRSHVIAENWLHLSPQLRLVSAVQRDRLDIWFFLRASQKSDEAQRRSQEKANERAPYLEANPLKLATLQLAAGKGRDHLLFGTAAPEHAVFVLGDYRGVRAFQLDLEGLEVQGGICPALKKYVGTAAAFIDHNGEKGRYVVVGVVAKIKRGQLEPLDKPKLLLFDLQIGKGEILDVVLDSAVSNISVAPDGRWLAARTVGGRVAFWSLDRQRAGRVVGHFPEEGGAAALACGSVAFSPDGRYALISRMKVGRFILLDLAEDAKFMQHSQCRPFPTVICAASEHVFRTPVEETKKECSNFVWLAVPTEDVLPDDVTEAASQHGLEEWILDKAHRTHTILMRCGNTLYSWRLQVLPERELSTEEFCKRFRPDVLESANDLHQLPWQTKTTRCDFDILSFKVLPPRKEDLRKMIIFGQSMYASCDDRFARRRYKAT